jgi:radical SAM enzyme (TIGR01210 family)
MTRNTNDTIPMLSDLIGQLQNHGLENELSPSRYYKFISALQGEIHARIPIEEYDTTNAAAPTSIREEIFKGRNFNRAVIYLLSNGCEWALKNAHGCTMCGHFGKQARKQKVIPAKDFIKQFENEYKKIDFNKNPLLNIFNNGSFLNDRELPPEARVEILKKINEHPGIKMLVVETRPEFVTAEKVREIKRSIPGKYIEIAVGLEIKDDLYRRLCLNKGFSLKEYNRAAEIITKYVHLRTYVFLKPLFLSERESIAQAVETIGHAFAQGSTTVSLEACTVQDFTLVKYLYDQNLYSPPWLWSILEVVKKCTARGKLIVGLFQFYPSPLKVPYNCPRCSDAVMEAICRYNRTLDTAVFENLNCQCREKWEAVVNEKKEPFEKRLKDIIGRLPGESPAKGRIECL